MSYIALYRKYRSQTFQDVIGQEHITRTLQNAIRQEKICHAYLFCGTRGTGKTTTARLLAKALNCEKGPTPEPCNECDACLSITNGSAVDIVEMDAASHRGVLDVKAIRENVKFPPMSLRYKVFIIDEAHQLSNDAKDAFLKTLEEPPPHAVFILATTEPHNIPITIRSRCQQFDFRRGSLTDIRSRMKYVLDAEGIEADDEALDIIAMDADGSYRDSLSLLEQVLSYTDGRLTPEDVYAVLGTVTQDFLFRMGDLIASGDEAGGFEAAREAAESGKDLRQLMRSMADHFRNLLFATVTTDNESRAFSGEILSRLRDQASKFDKPKLLRIIEIFSEMEQDARFSERHKLLLEMALLKAVETAKGIAPQTAVAEPVETISSPARSPAPPKQPVRPKPPPDVSAPEPALQAPAAAKQKLPEFGTIREKWNVVLQTLKTINIPTHALASGAVPSSAKDVSIVLQFKHLGQAELLEREPTKKKALQTAIERVFGVANVGIICEVGQQAPAPAPEPVPEFGTPELMASEQDTALQDVLDIFNGKIVDE